MTTEILTQIASVAFVVISNIIAISMFISKQDARIKHCEEEITSLKSTNVLFVDEIKTLHKIEGQLELLIKHFMKNIS
mgnify:CR=1 FL=1